MFLRKEEDRERDLDRRYWAPPHQRIHLDRELLRDHTREERRHDR